MIHHEPATRLPAPADLPVTLTLTPAEVRLVRTALHLLRNTYTRHEGLHPAIQDILVRLPADEQA